MIAHDKEGLGLVRRQKKITSRMLQTWNIQTVVSEGSSTKEIASSPPLAPAAAIPSTPLPPTVTPTPTPTPTKTPTTITPTITPTVPPVTVTPPSVITPQTPTPSSSKNVTPTASTSMWSNPLLIGSLGGGISLMIIIIIVIIVVAVRRKQQQEPEKIKEKDIQQIENPKIGQEQTPTIIKDALTSTNIIPVVAKTHPLYGKLIDRLNNFKPGDKQTYTPKTAANSIENSLANKILSQSKVTDRSLELQDLSGLVEVDLFGSTIDPNSTARDNASTLKILSPKQYNENGQQNSGKFQQFVKPQVVSYSDYYVRRPPMSMKEHS